MAKIDKMEQKYQMLKYGGAFMKYNPLDEEMKKSYKLQMKNSYRSQMGQIKLEISRLESDLIKADERKEENKEIKEKLEELRKEKKELEQDNQKLKNETGKLNSEISFNQLEDDNTYVEKKISKNLMEGYLKNHEAIDRIIELRDNTKEAIEKLETKLEKEKEQTKKYEEIEKLEARVEAGKEINSTISNEEYLALVSELEEKRASLGKKPNVEKIEKEIESKKMMVTKCNLAWKCLFRNETWDDIHIKAVRINSQKKARAEIEILNNEQQEIPKQEMQEAKQQENNDEQEVPQQEETIRDTFIEELRSYSEKDNSRKEALNQEYIEKHNRDGTNGIIPPKYRLENNHFIKGNKKIQSIIISEKTGEVTVIGEDGEEISKNKILKHNLKDNAEKISLYNDIKGLKLCNEIAENKKDAKKLMKKLNPSILLALQDNKEMIREYVNAVHKEEKLPFELTHDLEGMNPIKKFFKQRSKQLKAEEKYGTKILNRLFDKSKALDEGKEREEVVIPEIKEDYDREIETEEIDEQPKENIEKIEKGPYKHASKEFRKKYKENPEKTDHEIYLDYFKQSKENTNTRTENSHDEKG